MGIISLIALEEWGWSGGRYREWGDGRVHAGGDVRRGWGVGWDVLEDILIIDKTTGDKVRDGQDLRVTTGGWSESCGVMFRGCSRNLGVVMTCTGGAPLKCNACMYIAPGTN